MGGDAPSPAAQSLSDPLALRCSKKPGPRSPGGSEELLSVPNVCLSLSSQAGLLTAWASAQLSLGRKTLAASALGRADHEPTKGDISETGRGRGQCAWGLSFSSFLKESY